MDFFESQNQARRSTFWLVVLYALAVVAVVMAVDLLLAFTWLMNSGLRFPIDTTFAKMLRAVPRPIYAYGALATFAVIVTVSIYNILKLAEGGEAVARMMGARHIPGNTRDLLEKRLVNVVEEMAIAAGVRVPQVYVMDQERGINAFAAGYDIGNTVIAVTRGTLETLSRDELQGVIGHEFSHILNGDMRLNIRMIGVLAGIVFIGAIGSFLISPGRSDRDRQGTAMFFTGLVLLIIGYVGLFFARLIKAAVSRQREFLADASSVQFTRNPDGIAGALDQIRASTSGALIQNRHAESLSHMFFGQGITVWLGGLFDTHPPINERIERVRPGFQSTRYRHSRSPGVASDADQGAGGIADNEAAVSFLGGVGAATTVAADGKRRSDIGESWGRDAGQSAKLVGTLDAGKVGFAQRLLAQLPQDLREAMRTPDGASAVMIGLLLARQPDIMAAQLAALRGAGHDALAGRAQALAPAVQKLGRAYDLLLVDVALPALKSGATEIRQRLLAALQTVIEADRRMSVHEFAIFTFANTQLRDARSPAVKYRSIAAAKEDVLAVLSMVAHAGRRAGTGANMDGEVEAAFAAGAKEMGIDDATLLPIAGFTLTRARAALERLQYLAPLAKAVLVKGLFAAVTADGTIRMMEAELMRMIGAVLDCPLPPLLTETDPATFAV